MRRVLIITSDKNQAIQLRSILESMRAEFEIAIGEETGRAILSRRYMNLIMLEATTLEAGTSWVFSFLANRGLDIPIIILGADEGAAKDIPPEVDQIRYAPYPLDQENLENLLMSPWPVQRPLTRNHP